MTIQFIPANSTPESPDSTQQAIDSGPAALGAGTPTPVTASIPNSPTPTANPPQIHPAVAKEIGRKARLGHIFESVKNAVEGRAVVGYKPDETGNLVPQVQQRRPGALFRDILTGMLSGAAASADSARTPSPAAGLIGGFGKGFTAAHQVQQNRLDQLRKQAADEQVAQKKYSDNILMGAATADGMMNDLNLGHYMHVHTPAEMQRVTDSNREFYNLVSQDANAPPILDENGQDINGKAGNGPQLMQMYNQDPKLMDAGEGFHRVPFFFYDMNGLDHDHANGYMKDGQQADLNDHPGLTVKFLDVPVSAWNKTYKTSAKTINSLMPGLIPQDKNYDPNKQYSLTLGSVFGLNLKNKKNIVSNRDRIFPPVKDAAEWQSLHAQNDDVLQDANATEADKTTASRQNGYLDRIAKQRPELVSGNKPNDPKTADEVAIQLGKAQQAYKQNPSPENRQALDTLQQQLNTLQAAKAGNKVPTNIGEARAAVDTARIAYSKNPNPESAQALKDAQVRLTGQREEEANKRTADARATRNLDREDENVVAQSLANGEPTALKDVASLRGDQRVRIFAQAKKLNPNFNTTTAKLKADTLESFTKGKQADQIQSFGTFIGHAADASDVVNDYRSTQSPLINKPLNWIRKNAAGDPGYSQFVTSLAPVRDEFMTFLQNNHALTESDKKAADTIMSDNSSPAQIQAALKQMTNTAFIRLGELNSRYKRVMGEDFPDLLDADAVQASDKLGYGAQARKYRSGGQVTGARTQNEQRPPANPVMPVGATMKVPGSDGKMHWS